MRRNKTQWANVHASMFGKDTIAKMACRLQTSMHAWCGQAYLKHRSSRLHLRRDGISQKWCLYHTDADIRDEDYRSLETDPFPRRHKQGTVFGIQLHPLCFCAVYTNEGVPISQSHVITVLEEGNVLVLTERSWVGPVHHRRPMLVHQLAQQRRRSVAEDLQACLAA
jgi:hypothetical protein